MSDEVRAGQVYTDFQGLAALRSRAREGSPEALEVAAKQFEAYLVQQLLRSGRDASLGDGILDNKDSELYQEMFDKQIALSATQGKGFGIAEMLVRQIQRAQGVTTSVPASAAPAASATTGSAVSKAPAATGSGRQQTVGQTSSGLALPWTPGVEPTTRQTSATMQPGPAGATPTRFDTAQEFVAALMPDAQRVGEELGVDPRLLVAQAALETGWGKSIIRNSDGTSSHNLFNIKANRGWDGAAASARTFEYENGAMVKVGARFRSYASFADSFRDYLQFLRSNPRYGEALQQTHDPAAYAQSLQAAGYATDPRYADKIMTIYGMDEVASAVG
jgi:peptidoglycan hydrolase FlgJ